MSGNMMLESELSPISSPNGEQYPSSYLISRQKKANRSESCSPPVSSWSAAIRRTRRGASEAHWPHFQQGHCRYAVMPDHSPTKLAARLLREGTCAAAEERRCQRAGDDPWDRSGYTTALAASVPDPSTSARATAQGRCRGVRQQNGAHRPGIDGMWRALFPSEDCHGHPGFIQLLIFLGTRDGSCRAPAIARTSPRSSFQF
jgi:hypothetical protein